MSNKISVEVEALTAKFESEMKRVNEGLAKLEKNAEKTEKNTSAIKKFFQAYAQFKIAERAATSLYNFSQAVSENANVQTRFAEAMGVSADFIGRLDAAFARNHVKADEANKALFQNNLLNLLSR